MTFAELGLAAPLLAGLTKAGFTTPTPIQAQAIGPQLVGRDILGIAQTGTGKTAAFGLPILHALHTNPARPNPKTCRALILAPTRELAVQILEHFRELAGGVRFSSLLILGGVSRSAQVRAMQRGVDIVVATPGRLTDLMRDGHIRLDETRNVVLDEADRMLDMGFIRDVRFITERLHPRRQSALFSATMPTEVAELAATLLNTPVRVEVAPQSRTADKIAQRVEFVSSAAKRARLVELLADPAMSRVIVFARTKHGCDRVTENLEKDGVLAEAIHGNKSQNARQRALNLFRQGKVRVLVATDIAARGIDVTGISHVINYELPDEPESYVHRIGRTARNGADGEAITLCDGSERDKLRAVERITGIDLGGGGLHSRGSVVPKARGPRPGFGGRGQGPAANSGNKPSNPGAPRRRRPTRDAA